MAARLTTYLVVGIVAATLIAGLIVGAQRDDSEGPVDLIVHNAKVYTADGSRSMAEAVAIRGNQILRVGSNREINRLRRPQTMVVDAEGAAVVPGFNDAHVHFIDGGLRLSWVNLDEATTLEEIEQQIDAWASDHPNRPWILGRGWRTEALEGTTATRLVLDAIVKERPVQLLSADGRSAWLNSRALQLARITKRTPNPKNGVIVRDARTGEPTGLLTGQAMRLAARAVPPAGREERERALRTAITAAHRSGVTSVQDIGVDRGDFELYDEVRRAGDLNVRVYAAPALGAGKVESEIEQLVAIRKQYPDDPLFKTGALTLALDGELSSHTAALLEPYEDRPGAGDTSIEPDALNRTVRLLDAAGWQIMIDAAGDRAIRMALDAYAHAIRSNPSPPRDRRHRVEHVEIPDAADIGRFKTIGVIASIQPFHGTPEPARAEEWSASIGAERVLRAWALRSLSTSGARLVFGSDWPAAPLMPMLAVHTAVTRTTADGLPEDGWNSAERINLKAALDAYTSGAAYASFDEQRKGSIKAGMLADLTVLSTDIFAARPPELATAGVEMTIFDGRIVYRRGAKSTN
jgi:predicted amidohydrolase YtcJ